MRWLALLAATSVCVCRALTRFECFRCSTPDCLGCPAGAAACHHALGASAVVRDLTLTLASEGAVPVAMTVTVEGEVELIDVDVEMPSCDGCTAVGAAVLGADARLTGVDVTSGAGGAGWRSFIVGTMVGLGEGRAIHLKLDAGTGDDARLVS